MANDKPKIVIGVDGSAASKDALRWAARQAEVTDGRLQVVLAWRQPVTYGYPPDYSDANFEKDARQTLDRMLSDVLGTPSTVPVDARVIEGHAAPILLEAARDADLLVVGSHGHGAFIGMLRGLDQSALHTPCGLPGRCRAAPVEIVIRTRRRHRLTRSDRTIP